MLVAAVAALALLLAGSFYFATSSRTNEVPSVLRIGVLPDENPSALRSRYAPLLDYLKRRTGIQTRLVVPANYDDSVRLFAQGEVDLAYFGGYTFVKARAQYDAEPLVMREIDTRFVSWFVTRSEFENRNLEGFRNNAIGFGSRLSTSGHLMPRHFLKRVWEIEPENYFSRIEYFGEHDETVRQVLDGRVDIGAANSVIVKKMIDSGQIAQDDLHVVWETPPFPDYVWATQNGIDENLKTALRNAFLSLEYGNAEHDSILEGVSARAFLPADPNDFKILAEVATELGLTQGDLQ